MNELGKRAVACKHWRWMPGMKAVHRWIPNIRILCDDHGEYDDGNESYVVCPGPDGNEIHSLGCNRGVMGSFPTRPESAYDALPDLSDPATLGCLLALVREAWACCIYTQPSGPFFVWRIPGGEYSEEFDTEAEALVAALEAAP